MIDFPEIDMMVRGGILVLLFLWSWLLLRDHRHVFAARMAIIMNVSIACHVLATIPGPVVGQNSFFVGPPDYRKLVDVLAELGSVSVPPAFWLFARAWFNDEEGFGLLSGLAIPTSMVLVCFVDYNFAAQNAVFQVSALLLRLFMYGFGIAGLWVAWRGRDNDLVESRRRLRTLLIVVVGILVLLTNTVEIAAYRGVIDHRWRSLLQIGNLIATASFCITMFGIRQTDLLAGAKTATQQSQSADADDDPLAQRLHTLMRTELPHRDEAMTIARLAVLLGEQEYRLRRLINGTLGHRNFAQFLNGYRLAEVKSALADPSQKDVSILTIALDAGFGSLGPFNRAFREAEGMTPSAFRMRAA